MKTNEALQSLDLLEWSSEDKALDLPKHVRECIAAEYGQLSFDERGTVVRSSYSTGNVKFGVSTKHEVKAGKTAGLHLLSLCIGLDSIANKPVNSGLVLRLDTQLLPKSIMTWLHERRHAIMERAKGKTPVNA